MDNSLTLTEIRKILAKLAAIEADIEEIEGGKGGRKKKGGRPKKAVPVCHKANTFQTNNSSSSATALPPSITTRAQARTGRQPFVAKTAAIPEAKPPGWPQFSPP